jgi:hypothetical protein
MERAMFRQQQDPERSPDRPDSLFVPARDGLAHGPYSGHVMKSSAYTTAVMSDVARVLPYVAAGVALAAGVRRWRSAA